MVTKDTGIIEAVQNHPEIMEVFAEYGLGCIGCMAAHFETIIFSPHRKNEGAISSTSGDGSLFS